MKITFKENRITFSEIEPGQVCKYNGKYYLAVQEITPEEGDFVNAVRLNDGLPVNLSYTAPVEYAHAEMIVGV